MAKSPSKTSPKGIGEALLAGLSKQELEQWRQDRLNEALYKKGVNGKKVLRSYAKEHNDDVKATKRAIEKGSRLTQRQINKLTNNVAGSLGYSAGDVMKFTLGNTKTNRVLSPELLGLYLTNIAQAKAKFAGGISPQEVIYLSLPVDIKRANEQIFMAQLFKRQGNVFYFVTNAGVYQEKPNHKVTVQFTEYESLITGASKVPTQYVLGEFLKHKKIKFDCDCSRHAMWYRFVATKGKYNFGIDEDRYPTKTNPNLRGVACKHVLRVMKMLQSGQGIHLLTQAINEDLQKGYNVASIRIDKKELAKKAIVDANPKKVNHHTRQIKKKITTHLRHAFFEYQKEQRASQRRTESANSLIAKLTQAGLVLSKEHKDIINQSMKKYKA